MAWIIGAEEKRTAWLLFIGKLDDGVPGSPVRNSNKGWYSEWFIMLNPAPGLPPRIGSLPVHKGM